MIIDANKKSRSEFRGSAPEEKFDGMVRYFWAQKRNKTPRYPDSFFESIKSQRNIRGAKNPSMIRYTWKPVFREDVKKLTTSFTKQRSTISTSFTMSHNSNIKPIYKLVYENEDLISNFLGISGISLLQKILLLVNYQTKSNNWPLTEVAISYTCDPEIINWNYILVLLTFNTDFEHADKYLHDFYKILDISAEKLTEDDKNLLQGKIFFDIKIALSKD
jgi:hypothetical protein